MANRKQRRKNREKYNFVSDETNNTAKVIITLLIVVAIVSIFFLITVLVNNNNRKLDIKDNTNEEIAIQYKEILANDTFVMEPKEYYVLFYDFEGANASYYEYLYTQYASEEGNYIYKVDLGSGFNEKFVSDKTNPKAQMASQLKVKSATLILIKNGKNVSYIEGDSQKISSELN